MIENYAGKIGKLIKGPLHLDGNKPYSQQSALAARLMNVVPQP